MTKKKTIFDMKPELANSGVRMPILDPNTKEDTGSYIELLSEDSKKWRDILHKSSKERLKKNQRNRFKDIDLDELEEESLINLSQLIVGWGGDLFEGFEYSEENAKILVKTESLYWLLDEIRNFVRDEENFLKR